MRHPILTNENKQREEDSFQRNDCCEETEWKRIKRLNTKEPDIEADPYSEPDAVGDERSSTPCLPRYRCRDAVHKGPRLLMFPLQLCNSQNAAICWLQI